MKDELFAPIQGEVLEIGPGAGINFRHYPKGVHVLGVEPNPFMHPHLEDAAQKAGLSLSLVDGNAESLSVAADSVDAVVSTLVLCSVSDPIAALREIVRVLKPGGTFYFIEHVAAAPRSFLRRTQEVVAPCWRCIGDGCHPNRETKAFIQAAEFDSHEIRERWIKSPLPIVSPHILGTATK